MNHSSTPRVFHLCQRTRPLVERMRVVEISARDRVENSQKRSLNVLYVMMSEMTLTFESHFRRRAQKRNRVLLFFTLQSSCISHASHTRGTEGSRCGTARSRLAGLGDHPYLRPRCIGSKACLNRSWLPESSAVLIAEQAVVN